MKASLVKAASAAAAMEDARRELVAEHEEKLVFMSLQLKNAQDNTSALAEIEEVKRQHRETIAKLGDAEQQAGAASALLLEKDAVVQELRNQVSSLRTKASDDKKVVDKAQATARRMEELEKSAKEVRVTNSGGKDEETGNS